MIGRYWQDFPDYEDCFIPGFLANDILRLWRTFCVNYEVRTENTSVDKRARKIKNYKLKHSRLLTCYSALLFLLEVYRTAHTVRVQDAMKMIQLSPTERLEWVAEVNHNSSVQSCIATLLDQYDRFLTMTDYLEAELAEIFQDEVTYRPYKKEGHAFGDSMLEAINLVGQNSLFHRILTV